MNLKCTCTVFKQFARTIHAAESLQPVYKASSILNLRFTEEEILYNVE